MLYGFDPNKFPQVIDTDFASYAVPTYHPNRQNPAFHDIFYLIDGYWNVYLEDEEINLLPGDIAFLPAYFHHYSRQVCREETRTIFIHFSKEPSDRIILDNTSNTDDFLVVRSHSHDYGSIIKYFHDIVNCFWSDAQNKEQRCSAFLYLLLSEMSDIFKESNKKSDRLIVDLINFITINPDKFFTISELAKKTYVSPKTLTSRFRKETGQSLHKYQMDKKLDRVASLLRTESLRSLKNLAHSFGFYDEFHLSSAFKKKFNVSPSQYSNREINRNK